MATVPLVEVVPGATTRGPEEFAHTRYSVVSPLSRTIAR
jgi:hypothetical protein